MEEVSEPESCEDLFDSSPDEELPDRLTTERLAVDNLGETGRVIGSLAILGTPLSPQLSRTRLSRGSALKTNSSADFGVFCVLGFVLSDCLVFVVDGRDDEVVRVDFKVEDFGCTEPLLCAATDDLAVETVREAEAALFLTIFGATMGLVSFLLAFNCLVIALCLSNNCSARSLGGFADFPVFSVSMRILVTIGLIDIAFGLLFILGGVWMSKSASGRILLENFKSSSSSLDSSYLSFTLFSNQESICSVSSRAQKSKNCGARIVS